MKKYYELTTHYVMMETYVVEAEVEGGELPDEDYLLSLTNEDNLIKSGSRDFEIALCEELDKKRFTEFRG